ncbi:2,3,4,5-tetrahydropyridine-2,6-dicarboxylate N-succinyltransferase [bacterium]|nr:2,3,4,5-tetrahydropyridine-2,6-dicarboxylate N-succinyltransferase [bacterium]
MNFESLEKKILELSEKATLHEEDLQVISKTITHLDRGEIRVASKEEGEWVTHAWVKKAILLYFKTQKMTSFQAGPFSWWDKIPVKSFSDTQKVRSVPPAFVRHGAYVAPGAILMPSYVNIGAYVDEGTMVDTWATVGSCAQIGKGVHLSGGVGIGGVLEPAQAQPVVIEDHAFIGSRCIVVEGVKIGESAVLGAGVTLTKSTKIIDMTGSEPKTLRGEVPPRSVVIPGSLKKEFPAGEAFVPCALIIGERSAKTDQKTSLNDVLREFEISV